MAKFIYKREVSCAFTLNDGTEFHLHQGYEYELPEDNEFIASLVDQEFLEAVPPTKSPKTKEK